MRFRTTWYLLIGCLVLGVLCWHYIGHPSRVLEKQYEWAGAFHMEPDRIRSLRIEREDTVLEFIQENKVWRMVEPIRTRANAGEIDRLLTRLSSLEPGEVITEWDRRSAQLTLADYGLDRPQCTVSWNDGVRSHRWLIGRLAPVGEQLYVKEEESHDIIAVTARLLDWIPTHIAPLRDDVLIHGEPRLAHRLAVTRAGGFVQLMRDDDGLWRIQQPLAARADRLAVQRMLDQLFSARIKDYVADNVSDMTAYGLDPSATHVALWIDRQEEAAGFYLGAALENEPERIYARRTDGESVFAVSRELLDVATIRVNDLRDRDLIPWSSGDVHAMTLTRGTDTVTLERHHEQGWMLTYPYVAQAENSIVEGVIEAWMAASIERFYDHTPTNVVVDSVSLADTASIQFERRQSRVDASRRAIELSMVIPPATSQWVVVSNALDQAVYDVGRGAWDETKWSIADYRQREIFRIPAADIRRLELRRENDATHILIRNENGDLVPLDKKGVRTTTIISDVLAQLNPLRAARFVPEREAREDSFGLDDPMAVLTIGLSGEAGIGHAVMLGDVRSDGGVYARTRGHDHIFILSAETATLLLSDLYEAEEPAIIPEETDDDQ